MRIPKRRRAVTTSGLDRSDDERSGVWRRTGDRSGVAGRRYRPQLVANVRNPEMLVSAQAAPDHFKKSVRDGRVVDV